MRHLLAAGVLLASSVGAVEPPNVAWTTPSLGPSGSMPLGNGRVGINVWVNEHREICFYVSHTDAWSETNRLLKLGTVKLRLSPVPEGAFLHALRTGEGRMEVVIGDWRIDIWVDANDPLIWLRGEGVIPRTIEVSADTLRPARKRLEGQELDSSWTMRGCPDPVWEEADHVIDEKGRRFIVHRNETSIVPLTWKHQGYEESISSDPLLGRTFGIAVPTEPIRNTKKFALAIPALVTHPGTIRGFVDTASTMMDRARNKAQASLKQSARWWRTFWERSWIEVEAWESIVIPTNGHPLRIGHDSNNENVFRGELVEVAVWRRALASSQIEGLATSKRTAQDVTDGRVLLSEAGEIKQSDQEHRFHDGITIASWIVPSEEHPVGRLVDKLTAGQSDGFLLDTHPGNAIRLIVGDRQFVVEKALTPGVRTHVAAVVDTALGEVRLYRDGKVLKTFPARNIGQEITQAYALQRFMNACGSRGDYPIKFNGSIFTVEPAAFGLPFNADWRRWGGDYWYQNTRLPYAAMIASGDYDLMEPFFRLYESNLEVCARRAREYYSAPGAYFPETMTIFGSYSNGDYGWDRKGLDRSNINSPWWQFAWNQGPELLALMIDRYEHAPQPEFAKRLETMGSAILSYFDRFPRVAGKMEITPTQAVETYWHDVVNDTPALVGLHSVLDRILLLPNELFSKSFVSLCKRLRSELPPIPVKAGKILPAERYKDERSNVENPELYALWPFRWAGIGTDRLELAQNTFRDRIERSRAGWQYDGQCAAIAGLAHEAAQSLSFKVGNSHPGYRWPATWGPNYDWLPDQTHGGNIMLTLQNMCLQEVNGKMFILPAWPKQWNVRFRLRASKNTTVEVRYSNGKLADLKVTPKNRERDLGVMEELP